MQRSRVVKYVGREYPNEHSRCCSLRIFCAMDGFVRKGAKDGRANSLLTAALGGDAATAFQSPH